MTLIDDADLRRFLEDDCPFSDVTTAGLEISDVMAQASFEARDDMPVCGSEAAVRLSHLAGAQAKPLAATGAFASAGTRLVEIAGTAGQIHRTYKVAQTLMEVLEPRWMRL